MDRSLTQQASGALQSVQQGAATLGGTVGLLWMVHAVNMALSSALTGYGIVPRTLDGLAGVAFAPFLHGNLSHLLFNSISLIVLGAFTMLRKRVDFAVVSVLAALTSGLGAWVIGAPGTVHIGASGVIFGYLGFLMARGIFERSLQAIVLSGLVTWFFGSMVWGVLPTVGAAISWEAHLFGFIGGIIAARTLGRELRERSRAPKR